MSDDLRLDPQRMARIGLGEAVYCAAKRPEQIVRALRMAEGPLLLTRMSVEQHGAVTELWSGSLDYDPVSRTAIHDPPPAPTAPARAAIVSAGASDRPTAREAARTLAFHGCAATEIGDVGVAGLWRLLEHIDALRGYRVIIAVAGMEGALFSVLAGLVPGLVIAAPTAVGHGVAEGGRIALDAALASCAPGVVAVNIDSGFQAACAAIRVLRATGAAAP